MVVGGTHGSNRTTAKLSHNSPVSIHTPQHIRLVRGRSFVNDTSREAPLRARGEELLHRVSIRPESVPLIQRSGADGRPRKAAAAAGLAQRPLAPLFLELGAERASATAMACCACCQSITGATSASSSASDSSARWTIASPFGIAVQGAVSDRTAPWRERGRAFPRARSTRQPGPR
jgi:hypothetical protein